MIMTMITRSAVTALMSVPIPDMKKRLTNTSTYLAENSSVI
jgi:hypothetical protein